MEQADAKHWFDPYMTLAAMETTLATRRLALRLRHLGGHVVQARAKQLDGAVMRYYQQLRQRRRI